MFKSFKYSSIIYKRVHVSDKLLANKRIQIRRISSRKLQFSDYGEPNKVIELVNEELASPKQGEVLVKMLASPVNPADINTIQGRYPVEIKLPHTAGNEGVGEVIEVHDSSGKFNVGDRVIPIQSNLGVWRTHALLKTDQLFKVPKELGLVEAATLTVNPPTAYRMLKDFVSLKPGDTVIQNGANSACGQNVIQLCRAFGYKSVNIVRNRADIGDLKKFLTNLGATHVLTEEEVRTTTLFKEKQIEKPKLALNCVGGKNALEMLRHISNGGTMVTYGGMSRDPVTIPTSALIFKDIRVVGFWMTRWSKDNFSAPERFNMFNELMDLMCAGKLQGPAFKLVPFSAYEEALMNALSVQGFVGRKYILSLQD